MQLLWQTALVHEPCLAKSAGKQNILNFSPCYFSNQLEPQLEQVTTQQVEGIMHYKMVCIWNYHVTLQGYPKKAKVL